MRSFAVIAATLCILSLCLRADGMTTSHPATTTEEEPKTTTENVNSSTDPDTTTEYHTTAEGFTTTPEPHTTTDDDYNDGNDNDNDNDGCAEAVTRTHLSTCTETIGNPSSKICSETTTTTRIMCEDGSPIITVTTGTQSDD